MVRSDASDAVFHRTAYSVKSCQVKVSPHWGLGLGPMHMMRLMLCFVGPHIALNPMLSLNTE